MIKGDCAKARKGLEVKATFGARRNSQNALKRDFQVRGAAIFVMLNCMILRGMCMIG